MQVLRVLVLTEPFDKIVIQFQVHFHRAHPLYIPDVSALDVDRAENAVLGADIHFVPVHIGNIGRVPPIEVGEFRFKDFDCLLNFFHEKSSLKII
jgi:hypothetical protein